MTKTEWTFVGTFVAIVAAGVAFAIHTAQGHLDEYAVVCHQSGGKTVFNGRFWECIK